MARPPITWNGLVYYGEVFGFALAWVAVIALASHLAVQQPGAASPEQIASTDAATSELSR